MLFHRGNNRSIQPRTHSPELQPVEHEQQHGKGQEDYEAAGGLTCIAGQRRHHSEKTTLLAALLGCVPVGERIVCVEEAPELEPRHPHGKVGPGRGAGVATGPFPGAPFRTRRMRLRIPGSPRVLPVSQLPVVVVAGVGVQGVVMVLPR